MERYVIIKTFFNEQDAYDWVDKTKVKYLDNNDLDSEVVEVNHAWRASVWFDEED